MFAGRKQVARRGSMSAYDGYAAAAAAATYGRMYGMAYPAPAAAASSAVSHYHGLQTAAAAAVGSAGGTGTAPTAKTYNGLCLTGTGVDLLHPAMHVYPGTVSPSPSSS